MYVDPGKDTVVYKRYYHMFRQGELEGLVERLKEKGWDLQIIDNFYEKDNWFVVVRVLGYS